jgi:hypothetical protein
MQTNAVKEFCKENSIEYADGLALIMEAVKYASKSKSAVYPYEQDGEIGFYAQTMSGEHRAINMKEAVLHKAVARLKLLVKRYRITESVNKTRQAQKVVRGTFDDRSHNGYYIVLPNSRAFMPFDQSVKTEAEAGCYRIGKTLHFAIVSASDNKGRPKIILSRRSPIVAKEIAERHFAPYGFVNVKRISGIKQTILLRAFPSRELQIKYQSLFPTERIVFHKLMPDGTIKRPTRQEAKEMRKSERD